MFALVGLFYGPSDASLSELASGLIRSDDGPMEMIIWSIRIPRIILSLLTKQPQQLPLLDKFILQKV